MFLLFFYILFYIPESLEKSPISKHVLNPKENFIIKTASGPVIEENDNYVSNKLTTLSTVNNKTIQALFLTHYYEPHIYPIIIQILGNLEYCMTTIFVKKESVYWFVIFN